MSARWGRRACPARLKHGWLLAATATRQRELLTPPAYAAPAALRSIYVCFTTGRHKNRVRTIHKIILEMFFSDSLLVWYWKLKTTRISSGLDCTARRDTRARTDKRTCLNGSKPSPGECKMWCSDEIISFWHPDRYTHTRQNPYILVLRAVNITTLSIDKIYPVGFFFFFLGGSASAALSLFFFLPSLSLDAPKTKQLEINLYYNYSRI